MRREPITCRGERRTGGGRGREGALLLAGSAPEYIAYHDDEWGKPVTTDQGLYERMTLEAFQSGWRGSRSCASARASGRVRRFNIDA